MRAVRQHLRGGVTAWLLCHALAFSALVPRDCCAAHAHREVGTPACHDPEPGARAHCAMPAADACQMHEAAAPVDSACRFTGVCNAPAAALAAVLLQGATAPVPVALAPVAWMPRDGVPAPAPRLVRQSISPDSPPPRA